MTNGRQTAESIELTDSHESTADLGLQAARRQQRVPSRPTGAVCSLRKVIASMPVSYDFPYAIKPTNDLASIEINGLCASLSNRSNGTGIAYCPRHK